MDLTTVDMLFSAAVGFALGLFVGCRSGASGVEVKFQSDSGTATSFRASKPSELAQILKMMREFEAK